MLWDLRQCSEVFRNMVCCEPRKTRQESRAQGKSTAMGKEGKEGGVPGCKVQSRGDYGPPRRREEGQSHQLREEEPRSLPATAQCGHQPLKSKLGCCP